MPLFNAETARLMAARSVAARKAAQAQRELQPAAPPFSTTSPTDTEPGVSVSCVRARLQTLDGLMARAKTDREWDNLTRAFDRLFRIWCVLTKTPGPGNLRPSKRDFQAPNAAAASTSPVNWRNFIPRPAQEPG